MMFCKHNWHVHKSAKGRSFRYRNLVKEEQAAIVLILLSLAFAGSTGVIVGSFVHGLIGLLSGTLLGIAYFLAYFLKAVNMEVNKDDPWIPKDKTCLKCNKLIMEATNAAHREATRLENEAAEVKRLAPFKEAADARYKRYMAMRAKAAPHI